MGESIRLHNKREMVRVERHFKEKELHVERPGNREAWNI